MTYDNYMKLRFPDPNGKFGRPIVRRVLTASGSVCITMADGVVDSETALCSTPKPGTIWPLTKFADPRHKKIMTWINVLDDLYNF